MLTGPDFVVLQHRYSHELYRCHPGEQVLWNFAEVVVVQISGPKQCTGAIGGGGEKRGCHATTGAALFGPNVFWPAGNLLKRRTPGYSGTVTSVYIVFGPAR